MALWKPFRGNRTTLDTVEKHDGYIYFCVDDGTLHFDYVDSTGTLQRKQINAKEAESLLGYSIETILNSSDSEIPTSKAVLDTVHDYVDNKTADDFGIYVQTQEPADAVAGDIWIDTANDPSYIQPSLPDITESDNGKVLMVVNGKLQLVKLNMAIDANGVVSM